MTSGARLRKVQAFVQFEIGGARFRKYGVAVQVQAVMGGGNAIGLHVAGVTCLCQRINGDSQAW